MEPAVLRTRHDEGPPVPESIRKEERELIGPADARVSSMTVPGSRRDARTALRFGTVKRLQSEKQYSYDNVVKRSKDLSTHLEQLLG